MRSSVKRTDSANECAWELIKAIKSGSFLIEGRDEDRVLKEVLEMVKGLFCSGNRQSRQYCRGCNDCQMLDKGSHPDLYWIEAGTGSGVIKIEDIRLLKERVNVMPFQAKNKVFIIKGAEGLSTAAANALLKTLEEPPAGVILILITQSVSQLLPTVVSRCSRIRFSQDESDIAADFEQRDTLLAGFFAALDDQEQKKIQEDISSLERNQTADLLGQLAWVFRDMLMIKLGAAAVSFMSSQSGQTLQVWAEKFSTADMQNLIDDTLRTKDFINSNANIKLSIDLLMKNINRRSCAWQLLPR